MALELGDLLGNALLSAPLRRHHTMRGHLFGWAGMHQMAPKATLGSYVRVGEEYKSGFGPLILFWLQLACTRPLPLRPPVPSPEISSTEPLTSKPYTQWPRT